MIASPDDARAHSPDAYRLYNAIFLTFAAVLRDEGPVLLTRPHLALDAIATALTEARIQGARDALKPAPQLDELTALSQEMGLYEGRGMRDIVDLLRDWAAHPEYRNDGAERCLRAANEIERLRSATPSPAIAPLREAVVEAAMTAWRTTDPGWLSDAFAPLADACAALSAAQGAAAEERTP